MTKMHEQSEQLTEFVDMTRDQIKDILERIREESAARTKEDDALNTRLSGLQKEFLGLKDDAAR